MNTQRCWVSPAAESWAGHFLLALHTSLLSAHSAQPAPCRWSPTSKCRHMPGTSPSLAPAQAAAPRQLQGQRRALPHCTLGPGAPLSAVATSLPETRWPQPRRRLSRTPGSRPWALGRTLGHWKRAGIPAEETPARELSLYTLPEGLQGLSFVGFKPCPCNRGLPSALFIELPSH